MKKTPMKVKEVIIAGSNGKRILKHLKDKQVEVDKKLVERLKKENWTPDKVKVFNEYKPVKELTPELAEKIWKSIEKRRNDQRVSQEAVLHSKVQYSVGYDPIVAANYMQVVEDSQRYTTLEMILESMKIVLIGYRPKLRPGGDYISIWPPIQIEEIIKGLENTIKAGYQIENTYRLIKQIENVLLHHTGTDAIALIQSLIKQYRDDK